MTRRRRRVRILDCEVDDVTMREAVDHIGQLVAHGAPSLVVTPNVDHLVRLRADPSLRPIYERAALVLADGMPLLWAARLLGTPLRQKVSGSDLFDELCVAALDRRHRLFLLGGRPGAADRVANRLRSAYPDLVVCGSYCPPLGFERDARENARAVAAVRAASPDILFVGLGAPKQERWILDNLVELSVPVSVGVGVTLDFAAGFVRRAPRPLQRAGLEWSWRLLMEPRRLWRRYLLEDPRFFLHLARDAARRRAR